MHGFILHLSRSKQNYVFHIVCVVCVTCFWWVPTFSTSSHLFVLLVFVWPQYPEFIFFLPSLIHPSVSNPPAPIPRWFFSLWIIQACRVCVFSVVVIATVTQTKPKLVRMHTYTLTHTCICIHMPIHTTKTPDSNTKAADELSLQGFHTITVLHPVSALLSQLWIIICLTLLCFPELSECKKMHNLETRNF